MYSGKFNVAPLFSWPQPRSKNTNLKLGSLGGFSYEESTPRSIRWNCMNEAHDYRKGVDIEQVTNVIQLFPHTRRHYPNPQYNHTTTKTYHAQSAQFLLDSHPEFDITPKNIVDILFEESYDENKNFDPYMGHELISIGNCEVNLGPIKKFIAFPMGISGTELTFVPLFNENFLQGTDYNVNQYQPDLDAMSVLDFKTPIRQVTSSIYENIPTRNLDNFDSCPSLIAVRTMSGTTFLKVIALEPGIDADSVSPQVHLKAMPLDSILHQKNNFFNHMHVTFNPMIYGEATIVDGNGNIHLWKGERHEDYSKLFIKYDYAAIRSSQADVNIPFKDLWKTCVYGAHPQTLFVASRTSIDLLDFRSSDATLFFDINSEDKIFSFQKSPVYNAPEFILTTQNNVILLDQRFPKRPMLMWAHYHSSPPCGVNIMTRQRTSIVLTWSKSPPTITSFQYLISEIGPITSTSHPVFIPSFIMHPTYSRSKYLRSPNVLRDEDQTTQGYQQHKLPSLSSVLIFKNDNITLRNADNNSHLRSCFSVLQLSQTGALYSQAFHVKDKIDSFIRHCVPSNKFSLQINEMSDSIASLHNLADIDVGTIPELRVKQNQNWHFERLWNYISKDFKCPSLNHIPPFVLKPGTLFISWENVKKFFEHYGHVAGFNCQKKAIVKDATGNVLSLAYACMEGKFLNKKNNKHKKVIPCEWQVTLSYIKSDKYIIITKVTNRHNHELFSSLYNSERWRSYVIDNTKMGTISNVLINSKNSDSKEILMNFDTLQEKQNIPFVTLLKKFYRDNLWIVNNAAHPLTLYEILKNIPSLHINDLEVPRIQQFSEICKVKTSSLELSIEWSLFDTGFLFEQLWNEEFNSTTTFSQIFGFPNSNIADKCPFDIEKGLSYYLQNTYPLPANKDKSDIDEIPSNLALNDHIKRSRQYAIDEVSRDLVICSQAFISRSQKCSKFLLSSDFLFEKQLLYNSTSSDCFAIKGTIDNVGTLEKENNGYVMSTIARELFNDWIMGQNLEEYDYRFLNDFINIAETPTIPINISKRSQKEILFTETENIAIENTTENIVMEKQKKKSRQSGFR